MITMGHAVDADLLRLCHEFLEQPTLTLTVPQTARLLDLRVERAAAILAMLEGDRWLIRSPEGLYRRLEPAYA